MEEYNEKGLEKYLCKINNGKTEEHGFFCKFLKKNKKEYKYFLITSDKIAKKNFLRIKFKSGEERIIYIYPGKELFNLDNYKIKAFEINPENEKIFDFLEYDYSEMISKTSLKNQKICIPYFSQDFKLNLYIGTINEYLTDIKFKNECDMTCPIILN